METTIIYWGYNGKMEKKMETTYLILGYSWIWWTPHPVKSQQGITVIKIGSSSIMVSAITKRTRIFLLQPLLQGGGST